MFWAIAIGGWLLCGIVGAAIVIYRLRQHIGKQYRGTVREWLILPLLGPVGLWGAVASLREPR